MRQICTLLIVCILFFQASLAKTPAQLIPVFQDNIYQFTGIAVSKKNRIFLTYPYWLEERTHSLIEVLPSGVTKPYPDLSWNTWQKNTSYDKFFVCAQAVFIDELDNLWVVDSGSPEFAGVVGDSANKLVKINLVKNSVEKVFLFPKEVSDEKSYFNDVRIDHIKGYAYLTDSANGAIIVLNLKTGESRALLHNHPSTQSDPNYVFKVNGEELKQAEGPFIVHSDGIALSPDRKYLYYKPLTDNKLYRIETTYLQNIKLSENQLLDKVEFLGEVSSSDGMIFDKLGNLYLSDIENNSIIQYSPSRKKQRVFITDTNLVWPDSFAVSSDNYLYVTASQIQNMPWFNDGKSIRKQPYTLFKIKL